MSGPTVIPSGGTTVGAASTIANAALFAEVTRGDNTVFDMMHAKARGPKEVMRMIEEGKEYVEEGEREQPIVDITDLSTKAGDTVSVDLMHARVVRPIMGDERISGRRGKTTFASQSGKINQFVFPWSGGGQMTQKRTPYDLRRAGVAQMTRSGREYLRQLCLVHMAGDRGQDERDDWVLPLESDAEFATLAINPILRPTYSRHHYGGEATGLASMDTTCFMRFEDISRLRVMNIEHAHPMPKIVVPDDPLAEVEPLGVLLVTDRQWYHMRTYYGANSRDWAAFQSAAGMRGSQNPLFKGGQSGMIDGILVKVMPRPIRFGQGTTVTVATSADTYATTTVTVATFEGGGAALDYSVDRALYLGGSAVAKVWGRNANTGVPTDFFEGFENDGREYVCSLGGIGGVFKLRFRSQSGVDTDYGVTVLDTYAPNPAVVRTLS